MGKAGPIRKHTRIIAGTCVSQGYWPIRRYWNPLFPRSKNRFTTNHGELDVESAKNLPKKKNNTVEDNLLGAESCAWLFRAPYQYWTKHVIGIEQRWRNFRQI